jgi:hypothetical protein
MSRSVCNSLRCYCASGHGNAAVALPQHDVFRDNVRTISVQRVCVALAAAAAAQIVCGAGRPLHLVLFIYHSTARIASASGSALSPVVRGSRVSSLLGTVRMCGSLSPAVRRLWDDVY